MQPEPVMILKGQDLKKDEGKLRWSLMPKGILKHVILVLMFGADKYCAWGWANGEYEDARVRYYEATKRHLVDDWWEADELRDKESKLPHLAHAICNLIFLLWYDLKYRAADYAITE